MQSKLIHPREYLQDHQGMEKYQESLSSKQYLPILSDFAVVVYSKVVFETGYNTEN